MAAKLVSLIYNVDGVHVLFVAVPNVPGYTHKVFVADKLRGWLGSHLKPSCKVADYYAKTYT